MRANLSTSWIFQGWIIYFIIILCAQKAISKSLHCPVPNQYLKALNCCDMCGPGYRLLTECSEFKDTICTRCGRGEYQPTWTTERRCLQQKFCDPGKGFIQDRPDNPLGEEPCRCNTGLQCSPINCEFCERIRSCKPGEGLESDPDSTSGRKICVACKKGFFSHDTSKEPCKQWTNCKTQGRSESQPGSLHTDVVCGPPVTGAATSWVVVSVLSVITVLSLLILLLFCYKDKIKLLSVNLRSCVQNLKRTRIQQETLAPLYHSRGGAGPGASNCTLCETTKLICQVPHFPTTETPHPFSTSALDVKVSLPHTALAGEERPKGKKEMEEDSEGSGEPEEVSEEEEGGSHLWAGSCACVVPVREPLEVGENEDCSQAVCPGTLGPCSCGGSEAEEKAESSNGRSGSDREKGGDVDGEKTGGQSLFSLSSPAVSPSSPPTDLCVPLSQARLETRLHLTDKARAKGEELYRLTSIDSASTPETTPTMASFNPLLTSSSVGELYLDKTPEASEDERDQGLSWQDSEGNKLLSSGFLELECAPESLQSQLAEPALTSGQVTGNHNTTFISSGQVMNFSGDVIVVYVSQTSLGNEGAGPDDAFGSPVQEQANETALFFQSGPATPGESVNHNLPPDGPLPVQEVMDEWPRRK